jgi:hypothetical protein
MDMHTHHDDDTPRGSVGIAEEHAGTRVLNHQRSARNDPSMLDGDSGRGNPGEYDSEEFRTDADIGATVPLDDESPDGDTASVSLPNAEAAVVPTADKTSTGADRGEPDDTEFETDDEVTAEAEDRDEPAVTDGVEAERLSEEKPADWTANGSHRESHKAKPARGEERQGRNPDADLPIEGYRHLTVPEILERVFEMPIDRAKEVQRYEGSHLRRKTLLVKLERYLRGK